MNIKTTLTAYYYDVSDEEQATEYAAMCADLKAQGLRCFDVKTNPSDKSPYRALSPRGTTPRIVVNTKEWCIELETEHLFNDQWNTAPIDGVTSTGLRAFNWYEGIYPNKDIKDGYYLKQTDEMREVLRNTHKCGYCGNQEPAAKGYTFCPRCLGGAYLTENELHLLRMTPVRDTHKNRAPLSEAERAHLIPLYVEAQTTAEETRAAAAAKKARRDVIKKAENTIKKAQIERDGFTWLLDNNINIDNCIYYAHTGKFSFGWRKPVSGAVCARILEVISEFPYPYEIESDDGRTLEGY